MIQKTKIKARTLDDVDFDEFGEVLYPNANIEKIEPEEGLLVTTGVGQIDVIEGEPEFNFLEVSYKPFNVKAIEKHLLTTQAIIPLKGCSGIIVLAPPNENDSPDLEKLTAVILDGTKGINLKRGTWHTAPFSFQKISHYIMVHRKNTLPMIDRYVIDLNDKFQKYFEIVV